uniref:CSON001232 protein n=1 Tax=Culicoides sonorensis TaxID=179676 RepID=A0A336LVQ3_CULSO
METEFNPNRRRSSGFSEFSTHSIESELSVASSLPAFSDLNSEVFVSKATGNGYPIIQSNGSLKFGPPLNFDGQEPGAECELYIKDFPTEFKECHLIPHFERFGEIYDFRLMMDYDNNNRGYAFVRFIQEEAANAALEVMKYFLLPNGSTLQVQKSYSKCRLYASNLPKDVPQENIQGIFRDIFPKMTNMTIHVTEQCNRAFAFIDFPDHATALEAKMSASPGYLYLFDREIKIVWAFPERQIQIPIDNTRKTLFIRNIGLSVNTADIKVFLTKAVPAKVIKNISSVRDFAFVDFSDHKSAEKVKEMLNGKVICKTPIEIEWARPPADDSIHNLKQTDFDLKLRLRCIANYWQSPIFIYGRVYEEIQVQCACVIIKSVTLVHYYFLEISYLDLIDMHSRICEVIVNLIEKFGNLPSEHLIIKVEGEVFSVIGVMKHMSVSPTIIPSLKYSSEFTIFAGEIVDLALMANIIGTSNYTELYKSYKARISNTNNFEFMNDLNINGRVLGYFMQKPRNNLPNLKEMSSDEMIFVLCCAYNYNNVNFFNALPTRYPLKYFYNNGVINHHQYVISAALLPIRFVQTKRNNGSCFGHITFGIVSQSKVQTPLQPQRPQWFYPRTYTPAIRPFFPQVVMSPAYPIYTPSVQITTNRAPVPLKAANSNAF